MSCMVERSKRWFELLKPPGYVTNIHSIYVVRSKLCRLSDTHFPCRSPDLTAGPSAAATPPAINCRFVDRRPGVRREPVKTRGYCFSCSTPRLRSTRDRRSVPISVLPRSSRVEKRGAPIAGRPCP